MTSQEVAVVIGLIAARYPNAKLGEDEGLTIQAWAMALSDVPLDDARAMLVKWFKVRRFPPDPSEIREAVLAAKGIVPDAEEAWQMARERARAWYPGIGWTSKEEPPTLPAPVQAALRAVGGISAINDGDVTREVFQKAYATYRTRYAADVNIADALPGPAPGLRMIG